MSLKPAGIGLQASFCRAVCRILQAVRFLLLSWFYFWWDYRWLIYLFWLRIFICMIIIYSCDPAREFSHHYSKQHDLHNLALTFLMRSSRLMINFSPGPLTSLNVIAHSGAFCYQYIFFDIPWSKDRWSGWSVLPVRSKSTDNSLYDADRFQIDMSRERFSMNSVS